MRSVGEDLVEGVKLPSQPGARLWFRHIGLSRKHSPLMYIKYIDGMFAIAKPEKISTSTTTFLIKRPVLLSIAGIFPQNCRPTVKVLHRFCSLASNLIKKSHQKSGPVTEYLADGKNGRKKENRRNDGSIDLKHKDRF